MRGDLDRSVLARPALTCCCRDQADGSGILNKTQPLGSLILMIIGASALVFILLVALNHYLNKGGGGKMCYYCCPEQSARNKYEAVVAINHQTEPVVEMTATTAQTRRGYQTLK